MYKFSDYVRYWDGVRDQKYLGWCLSGMSDSEILTDSDSDSDSDFFCW